MPWITRPERAGRGQFELAELEPWRHRAADERGTAWFMAFGGKPVTRVDDRLKRRLRIFKRIAESMRRQFSVRMEHMDIDRVTRIEMPDFIRPNTVPGGVSAIAKEEIDGCRCRTEIVLALARDS